MLPGEAGPISRATGPPVNCSLKSCLGAAPRLRGPPQRIWAPPTCRSGAPETAQNHRSPRGCRARPIQPSQLARARPLGPARAGAAHPSPLSPLPRPRCGCPPRTPRGAAVAPPGCHRWAPTSPFPLGILTASPRCPPLPPSFPSPAQYRQDRPVPSLTASGVESHDAARPHHLAPCAEGRADEEEEEVSVPFSKKGRWSDTDSFWSHKQEAAEQHARSPFKRCGGTQGGDVVGSWAGGAPTAPTNWRATKPGAIAEPPAAPRPPAPHRLRSGPR